MKGICFFDLDGTLLYDKDDIVPESALRGLSLLKENGYIVCLATGRDMDTHYSRKYKEIVKPNAIIHHNGTKITINGELVFEHFMDRELLERALSFAQKENICMGTSVGDFDYFTLPELKTAADLCYKKESVRNYRPVTELFEKNIPVSALSVAAPDVSLIKDRVEEGVPELELFMFDGRTGADCVERGFSKADGMNRVCAHYGIDIKDTYAFGDSENDIPMLKAAGKGVAMGNAAASVKEEADFVTAAIADDGIYKALCHLSLI